MRRSTCSPDASLRGLLLPLMAVLAAWLLVPGGAQAQRPPGIQILSDSTRAAEPPAEPVPLEEDSLEEEGETIRLRVPDEGRDHTIEISINGSSRSSGIVRFGESVTINEGEFVDGDVVVMGGSLVNRGRISGDCVAMGGSLTIGDRAVVSGDVVCIGGSLNIGEEAEISGDAVSVWGSMKRDPTAEVRGEVVEVGGVGPIIMPNLPWLGFGPSGFAHDIWSFLRRLVWVAILIGLGVVIRQAFPSRMERLAHCATGSGLKAFFAGLAGWVLWLPVFIALIITIVGIPVAIMLIFLTPLMVLLGYVAVAEGVGTRFGGRFVSGGTVNAKMAILVGILILEGLVLVARLFGVLGSIFDLLGMFLTTIGWFVIFIAATVGFGALLMTRFRPEDRPAAEAPGTTPPPPPDYGAPPPRDPASAPVVDRTS